MAVASDTLRLGLGVLSLICLAAAVVVLRQSGQIESGSQNAEREAARSESKVQRLFEIDELTGQLAAEREKAAERLAAAQREAAELEESLRGQIQSLNRQIEEETRAETATPDSKLVRECVDLFDEMVEIADGGGPAGEIADHVCSQLTELLQRCGVTILGEEPLYDLTKHQFIGSKPKAPDSFTVVRPGFALGAKVLRRAKVKSVESHES